MRATCMVIVDAPWRLPPLDIAKIARNKLNGLTPI